MKRVAIGGGILFALSLALFVLIQTSWVIVPAGYQLMRVNKVTGQVQWLYDGRFLSDEGIRQAERQKKLQSCRELLEGKRTDPPPLGMVGRTFEQLKREECQKLLQSE